jgi:CxxC motif-containing protein
MEIEKTITCTVCPKGCRIHAKIVDGEILEIKNYDCKRGLEYAKTELIDPKRVLTTIVKLSGAEGKVISVRTQAPISKDLLHKAMWELKDTVAKHPVKVGDVIARNIVGTGVDVIATGNSR